MISENGIETCILSYVKRIASPGLMQDTGCLGLVPWDDPEGWYGEGCGRGVQDGNTCTPWRRARQSTSVFLTGNFHGKKNLASCSP